MRGFTFFGYTFRSNNDKEIMMKKFSILLFCLISCVNLYAESSIKPIINGKVQNKLFTDIKKFGKPVKRIKGGQDDCNGGFFPDKLDFGSFKILDTGLITEVTFNQANGLIFHGQKVSQGIKKEEFLSRFKKHVWYDSSRKDYVSSQAVQNDSLYIDFYFKNNKLLSYMILQNNC